MYKDCESCFYNAEKGCMILHERQENCSSRANREEAERREEAIREYKSISKPIKCEPSKEILQKYFMKLYLSGYNDIEISKILKISASSINKYRKGLGSKIQSKRKKAPVGTGK